MVIFFLLITALFYSSAYEIASRIIGGNLAATVTSQNQGPSFSECQDFLASLSTPAKRTDIRVHGISAHDRNILEECDAAGFLRSEETSSFVAENKDVIAGSGSTCPSDFNQDGVTDQADVQTLVSYWGQCAGNCLGDINNDASVDEGDLSYLIAHWGICAETEMPVAGLILSLPFNGNTKDGSTYANNGTGHNIAFAQGHIHTSAQFTGNDSYISIESLANDIYPSAGTIAFWIKRDFSNDTSARQTYMHIGSDNSNFIEMSYDPDTDIHVFRHVGSGVEVKTQASPNDIPAGEWTHVAMTWDKRADDMNVFIDGVSFGKTKSGLGNWSGNISNVLVGKSFIDSSYFTGSVDEVLIYNRALTDSEVETIYSFEK